MTDPIQPIGPRRDLPPISPVQRREWRVDEDERREREERKERRNPRQEPRREPPEDGEHLIDIEA